MKSEEMTFKVLSDEGKEIECEVLFTFESEETGKNYIVYTDNSIDEDGNWTVAYGEGAEAEIIPGMPSEGLTPRLGVSEAGNWQISYDGGSSWEDITDGDGNPFPATGTSLTDSFFTDIVYNEENGTIDIVTADGQELSLNVHSGIITMEVEGYEEGMSILLNEALHLYAEFSPDVDGAYAECPEGWRVQITETEDGRQEIIVTAPSDGT